MALNNCLPILHGALLPGLPDANVDILLKLLSHVTLFKKIIRYLPTMNDIGTNEKSHKEKSL